MGFNGLMTMTRNFQAPEVVGGTTAKAQHVTMQPIPEAHTTTRS